MDAVGADDKIEPLVLASSLSQTSKSRGLGGSGSGGGRPDLHFAVDRLEQHAFDIAAEHHLAAVPKEDSDGQPGVDGAAPRRLAEIPR